MNRKVILLTGVPGVGKTYLATKLGGTISPLAVVRFGEVIFGQRKSADRRTSYADVRRNPDRHATLETVKAATRELIRHVQSLRTTTNVLIDSHAVAMTSYGFRITADSHDVLQQLGLSGIIVLHDTPERIARRVASQADGRRIPNVSEVAAHAALQDAVSLAYGVIAACPVFVVRRGNAVSHDLRSIRHVLNSLQVDYDTRRAKSS